MGLTEGVRGERNQMYFFIFLALSLHTVSGQSRCSDLVCLPQKYSKFKLPAESNNKIGIRFDLEEISKVDDWGSSITFSMYFNVEWNEPRLILGPQFGSKNELKPVSSGYLDKVWLPNIFVYNLKSYKVTEVFGKLAGVWVNSDKDILHSQAASATILCPMDFQNFPLDSQTCEFRLGSYSYNHEKMPFKTKHAGIYRLKERAHLPLQYHVELKPLSEPVIDYVALGNFSTAGFELSLSRKISPYITSYYLPSALLVCLSWITFLLPMEAVLGRLSVAMIPLFFLLHMLGSITSCSPKSADGMNALQIWTVSCLAFVLATFLQSAFLIRRNVNKSGLSDRKLEIWSVGGYFFLFVIFNISYWAAYI